MAQDTSGEGAHQSIEMISQRLRTLCEFYLVLHIIQIVAHLTTESWHWSVRLNIYSTYSSNSAQETATDVLLRGDSGLWGWTFIQSYLVTCSVDLRGSSSYWWLVSGAEHLSNYIRSPCSGDRHSSSIRGDSGLWCWKCIHLYQVTLPSIILWFFQLAVTVVCGT